jgi:hypothetical protein
MQRPVVSAACAALTLAAALALTLGACSRKPQTPEALYEEIARLNAAGDTGRIWDLLTDDAKKREMAAMESYRDWIRRNPDDTTDKFFKQFKCTRQEILTKSDVELYCLENKGNERGLVDAKIVDKVPDPRKPGEVVLTVQPPAGPLVSFRMRQVPDGWQLVEAGLIPK